MKKYIFIILSFGLLLLPIGALARVEPGTCSAKTDQSGCNATAGCGWDTDTGKCALCPYGTYNGGSGGCKNCQKPKDATFRNGDYHFQGMTHIKECPWSITCPENQEIYHDWGNNSTCGNCSKGYYKDYGTQYWDGTTMTGDCQPKEFTIHARILLPENCGSFTGTASHSFTYTASSNIKYSFTTIKEATKSKIDSTKYDYPTDGTNFTLTPVKPETNGPTVKLRLGGGNILFYDDTTDFNNISYYPNGQEFNMDITLSEKNPIRIYYCPSQFTNSGVQAGTCKATQYNVCSKPTAPNLSEATFNNGSSPNCSKGQYANSWKLLHPSNLTSYNWTASNNPVINFGDTIILPSGTNSTYFYMAPNFTNCPSGTYNGETTCPTQCESCPNGFTSGTGTSSKTECYINTTMKFKDKNNKSVTILSSPVYYEE